MKKLSYLLTLTACGYLLSPAACFGRLGETEEQLERRYGRPFYQTTDKSMMPPPRREAAELPQGRHHRERHALSGAMCFGGIRVHRR